MRFPKAESPGEDFAENFVCFALFGDLGDHHFQGVALGLGDGVAAASGARLDGDEDSVGMGFEIWGEIAHGMSSPFRRYFLNFENGSVLMTSALVRPARRA